MMLHFALKIKLLYMNLQSQVVSSLVFNSDRVSCTSDQRIKKKERENDEKKKLTSTRLYESGTTFIPTQISCTGLCMKLFQHRALEER